MVKGAKASQDCGSQKKASKKAKAAKDSNSSSSKAFRFDKTSDIVLLKEVNNIQPHLSPHGEMNSRWKLVSLATNKFLESLKLPAQTTPDNCKRRLSNLMKKLKADTADSVKGSGTAEEFDEITQLLEIIVHRGMSMFKLLLCILISNVERRI